MENFVGAWRLTGTVVMRGRRREGRLCGVGGGGSEMVRMGKHDGGDGDDGGSATGEKMVKVQKHVVVVVVSAMGGELMCGAM